MNRSNKFDVLKSKKCGEQRDGFSKIHVDQRDEFSKIREDRNEDGVVGGSKR